MTKEKAFEVFMPINSLDHEGKVTLEEFCKGSSISSLAAEIRALEMLIEQIQSKEREKEKKRQQKVVEDLLKQGVTIQDLIDALHELKDCLQGAIVYYSNKEVK